MGNVVSANLGQAPARQVARLGGLLDSTVCTTVNKVCASGMKAVMYASQSIQLGHAGVVVAGGFESMSQVPAYIEKQVKAYGHGVLIDGVLRDGLTDAYNGEHMGMCGELCATTLKISREEQDKFAIDSCKKAMAATAAGKFKKEIVPIKVAGKKGDVIVSEDETFKKVDFDRIPTLRPAFKKDGSITAANASPLSDGASTLLLMSASKAKALGLKAIARVRGFADAEQEPQWFTTSPSLALPKALKHAGLSLNDAQFHEMNEAFAVVILANQRLLKLDPARVNVNGGAVALGHPIGSSGARIITTLINVLQQNDATIGTASICNGGGGASAIVIERL